jgi:hypothetical protein
MTLPLSSSTEGLIYVHQNDERSQTWRAFDPSHRLAGSSYYYADPYRWAGRYPSGVDIPASADLPSGWKISFYSDDEATNGCYVRYYRTDTFGVTVAGTRITESEYDVYRTNPLTRLVQDGEKRFDAGIVSAGVEQLEISRYIDELSAFSGFAFRLCMLRATDVWNLCIHGPSWFNAHSIALPAFGGTPRLLVIDWIPGDAGKPNTFGFGFFTAQHDGGQFCPAPSSGHSYDVRQFGQPEHPEGPERNASSTTAIVKSHDDFVALRQMQEVATFAAYSNGTPAFPLSSSAHAFDSVRVTVQPLETPQAIVDYSTASVGIVTPLRMFQAVGAPQFTGRNQENGLRNLCGTIAFPLADLQDFEETFDPPVELDTVAPAIFSTALSTNAYLGDNRVSTNSASVRTVVMPFESLPPEAQQLIRRWWYVPFEWENRLPELWNLLEEERAEKVSQMIAFTSAYNAANGNIFPINLGTIPGYPVYEYEDYPLIYSNVATAYRRRPFATAARNYNQKAIAFGDFSLQPIAGAEFISTLGSDLTFTSEQSRATSSRRNTINPVSGAMKATFITNVQEFRTWEFRAKELVVHESVFKPYFSSGFNIVELPVEPVPHINIGYLRSGPYLDPIAADEWLGNIFFDPAQGSRVTHARNFAHDWTFSLCNSEQLAQLYSNGVVEYEIAVTTSRPVATTFQARIRIESV